MQAQPPPSRGAYLFLLGLTGACLGIGGMEAWRAVQVGAAGDWWSHATVALLMAFTAAYLAVIAKGKRHELERPDLPEPIDPATRDPRAFSR